jgi:hypothetical protein
MTIASENTRYVLFGTLFFICTRPVTIGVCSPVTFLNGKLYITTGLNGHMKGLLSNSTIRSENEHGLIAAGRERSHRVALIDRQSVKTTRTGGKERGFADGGY